MRAPRECPRDHAALAVRRLPGTLRDVPVDECPSCAGLYFDMGELHRSTGDRHMAHFLASGIGARESPLVCPGCRDGMRLSTVEDVDIDVCPSCQGIWLDARELERLEARDRAKTLASDEAFAAKNFDAKRQRLPGEGPLDGGDFLALRIGPFLRLLRWR